MSAPLEGLRVLDLSRVLAGPWIGQTLADLGAEVVKVEAPSGDDTRRWGPPFVEREGDRTAGYFYGCNRGKRSIALDFSDPGVVAVAQALAARADVVVENFRVGGLVKYGLDYGSVRAANAKVVYCSITGFGQDGPYRDRAGYDYPIQGISGIMSITGEPDGAPQRVGVALTDILTGLYGVIGILSALRVADATGEGQHIDMALLDTATAFLANQGMNYLLTGQPPARTGNYHPNIVPYQVFEVADGHIIIGTGSDAQFAKLCGILGCQEAVDDPRFLVNSDRVANRTALISILQERTRRWAKADLFAALEAATIPAGPINDLSETFADPQVIARGMQIAPEGVPGIRTPLRFSRSRLRLDRTAPRLDEHGAAIRAEIAGDPAPAPGGQAQGAGGTAVRSGGGRG